MLKMTAPLFDIYLYRQCWGLRWG